MSAKRKPIVDLTNDQRFQERLARIRAESAKREWPPPRRLPEPVGVDTAAEEAWHQKMREQRAAKLKRARRLRTCRHLPSRLHIVTGEHGEVILCECGAYRGLGMLSRWVYPQPETVQ